MSLRELFLPLLGDWTGVERLEASPWSHAGEARAALSLKIGVGETAVLQDYRQVRADGTGLEAHGVFMIDPDATDRPLRWWLFDSVGCPPVPAVGGWSGDGLQLTTTTPRGTAVHTWWRVDVAGEDRLGYRIDVDDAPILRAQYARISTH